MSGEHPNGRKAMQTIKRDLIKAGVRPEAADKRAREVAQRHAKQNR